MITKIKIENTATIQHLEITPYRVNYFFGGNGTGKTTISQFLSNENNYKLGFITKDSESEVLVYNKNFVDSNFQDKNAIKGIFTIGESAVEAEKFITEKEEEKKKLESEVNGYEKRIDSLQNEIDALKKEFEENCWEIQKELGGKFDKALMGSRKSREVFADHCLSAFTDNLVDDDLKELQSSYDQIYQKDVQNYPLLSNINIRFDKIESNGVFLNSIVTSSKSNFSVFIEKLGNINWVSQGLVYLTDSNTCPFCQQQISSNNLNELKQLFDETYTIALNEIKSLKAEYEELNASWSKEYSTIIERVSNIPFVSIDTLETLKNKLIATIENNLELMSSKIANPANAYYLLKTSECLHGINEEINKINKAITDNNTSAKNISKARKDFMQRLWNYISNQRAFHIIKSLKTSLNGKNRGLQNVLDYKKIKEDELLKCDEEIKEKRAGVVCIDNAVDEINSILSGFGFTGFKIIKKDDISYKLVRPDGTEVKETLSEGEHRFITFLYYYQLVKGTLKKDEINKKKILVIDDPISSLDSNILFIVSYLVRELISQCTKGSNIEQVFILTHNIYFHQEVSFKCLRSSNSTTKERFWLLRKVNEITTISGHDKNQINSSYELLWKELKNPNTESVFICNTMRRILEHYYKIIGHIDYETIIDSFEGQDKLICKTLLPFIHTGSHTINDDLHVSVDKDMVDKYKEIFKKIFENTNQIQHYEMMMSIN